MILIDDGQTVKKLLNHAYCAELALSYSEVCGGLPAGWRRLPASSQTCTGVLFGASRAFVVREISIDEPSSVQEHVRHAYPSRELHGQCAAFRDFVTVVRQPGCGIRASLE